MQLELEKPSMIPDRIEREIHIESPPERVWAVVTEAKHIGTWFGDAGATIDLRPGGLMTCEWREYGTGHYRVERVEPPRCFSYHWLRGGAAEPEPARSTLVELTLTPDAGGTRLRVVESGFRTLDLPEERRADEVKRHTAGWKLELDHLVEYIARGTA
jgi:uncharacterized protein YndB with AHSA1/START domain